MPVDILVGEELNGVCFVMDYVEFTFNGPVLRAIADPRVVDSFRTTTFPEPGSRDALCSLIGGVVQAVVVDDAVAIELAFADGRRLCIPLDDAQQRGGEWAHFITPGPGGSMEIW